MKPSDTSRILDAIAADFIPAETTLLPRIVARFERKTFMQTLRSRPALLILFVLLALSLLGGVAYAIGHLSGYIPGVGLVNQDQGLRILREPVSSTSSDHVTSSVRQLVADATHTFITYAVRGLSPRTALSPICTEVPVLQLPDGRKLELLGGGAYEMESINGEALSYETSYTYPPIPAGVKTISFLSPCGQPPLTLELVAAPAGFATPAVEIGATFEASNPAFASATPAPPMFATDTPGPTATLPPDFPATPTRVPHGSGLYLEKVVELDKSYILVGNFTDAGDLPGAFVGVPVGETLQVKITDANGQPVQYQPRMDIQPNINWGGVSYWAYEIAKPIHAPLTITLDSISIDNTDELRFPLDLGASPQSGQKWTLDRAVKLGGYDLTLDDITARKDGYTLHLHSAPGVPEGLSFGFDFVPGIVTNQSGTQDKRPDGFYYEQSMLFEAAPPSGNQIFSLTLFQTPDLPGPWTLTWSPQ